MVKTNKMKTLAFSLVLAAMTLTANNLNAQNGGGLFGRGNVPESMDYGNRDGLIPINSTTCTIDISDQTAELPVLSFSESD